MMTSRYSLLCVLAAIAFGSLQAQDHFFTAPGTLFHELHSEETGRDYQLLVTLPGSYAASPDKRYPTLYLTDAQWDMAMVTNILGKLNYDNHLPEMIIVGITYPDEDADYGSLRSMDLTPTNVEARNPGSGDAFKFLDFIENSVLPKIEGTYRTDPGYRALGGVSLGGLFALHAAYEKPNLFGRYIAISPALVWDDGYFFDRDKQHAADNDALPVRLYINYGSDEAVHFREPIRRFQEVLAARSYDDLKLKTASVIDGRHGSVAIEGWMRGLLWVFEDIHTGKPDPLTPAAD